MSYPLADHFAAFKALLEAAPGSPALKVYDTEVPDDPEIVFAKLDFYIETPDGLAAPDAVPLTMDSDVIDAWAYVHCVGTSAKTTIEQAAASSRAVSGRVRAQVLNRRLTIAGRECNPIRWREGRMPVRSEEIPGRISVDQTDVYAWRSVPG